MQSGFDPSGILSQMPHGRCLLLLRLWCLIVSCAAAQGGDSEINPKLKHPSSCRALHVNITQTSSAFDGSAHLHEDALHHGNCDVSVRYTDECRMSLEKDDDFVALFSSLLSKQPAILNSSLCSLMYHFNPVQAINKSVTDSTDTPRCHTHHFLCQHNSSQQSRTSSSGTAATARSLAASAFVPQLPSEPSPSLNNSPFPPSNSPTLEMNSPSSDAAFPGRAITPSPEETITARSAGPNGPYNHHIGDNSRSVPDGNSTKMAIGIGMMGLLVLSLSASALLAWHVKAQRNARTAPVSALANTSSTNIEHLPCQSAMFVVMDPDGCLSSCAVKELTRADTHAEVDCKPIADGIPLQVVAHPSSEDHNRG